jgi:hypothetical protein
LLGAGVAQAASASWGFDEAIISVSGKGSGGPFKDKYAIQFFENVQLLIKQPDSLIMYL